MKNFFKGLSFSQLFAGAPAAITSFLLSSKIGIAGSVIGVAVASIVSTAASQIYKNVIDASSKKLQDAAQNQLGLAPADPQAGDAVDGTDDAEEPTDSTQRIPVVQDDGEGERIGRTVSSSHGSAAHDSGTRPPMNARDKRVAIIVAVVSALVAVGATAGIILALTDGQGTDSVVRDIVHPTETTDDTRHKEPVPPSNPMPHPAMGRAPAPMTRTVGRALAAAIRIRAMARTPGATMNPIRGTVATLVPLTAPKAVTTWIQAPPNTRMAAKQGSEPLGLHA